jgi:hypothetical protein
VGSPARSRGIEGDTPAIPDCRTRHRWRGRGRRSSLGAAAPSCSPLCNWQNFHISEPAPPPAPLLPIAPSFTFGPFRFLGGPPIVPIGATEGWEWGERSKAIERNGSREIREFDVALVRTRRATLERLGVPEGMVSAPREDLPFASSASRRRENERHEGGRRTRLRRSSISGKPDLIRRSLESRSRSSILGTPGAITIRTRTINLNGITPAPPFHPSRYIRTCT